MLLNNQFRSVFSKIKFSSCSTKCFNSNSLLIQSKLSHFNNNKVKQTRNTSITSSKINLINKYKFSQIYKGNNNIKEKYTADTDNIKYIIISNNNNNKKRYDIKRSDSYSKNQIIQDINKMYDKKFSNSNHSNKENSFIHQQKTDKKITNIDHNSDKARQTKSALNIFALIFISFGFIVILLAPKIMKLLFGEHNKDNKKKVEALFDTDDNEETELAIKPGSYITISLLVFSVLVLIFSFKSPVSKRAMKDFNSISRSQKVSKFK
eukprot:TRINITY_DN2878_c2_g1_i1.p1 TRINITY_DN2878_c2_g1~~TRINITY_DN2878_c2_g1_i1.p1  ORF type:complete len:265 (+),score=50.23 TRINITY_DN2878_c2_g1_i1:150-944(+)